MAPVLLPSLPALPDLSFDSGSVLGKVADAAKSAATMGASSVGSSVLGIDLTRALTALAGLVCVAGAVYLFKPEAVNKVVKAAAVVA